MNKDYLIQTAKEINKVSEYASLEYDSKFDVLFAEINKSILERADITKLVGKDNLDMMKDNHANHLRFMSSMFKFYNPEVFVDTILWVFRAYRSHGFTSNYWATQINCWFGVLKNTLSEKAYSEIEPYYYWIQVNIPLFVIISDKQLDLPNSMH